MSATGRIAARNPDDFYATPAWAVDAVIPKLGDITKRWILEPSAGEGAIIRRLIAAGAAHHRITGVEINEGRAEECRKLCAVLAGDFLTAPAPEPNVRMDLVVMNPPFLLAQEFVERAMSHWLAPGGTCAALLRLAFVCSKKRAAFRKAHPFDLYPLASRPSFVAGGGTDSADYAWLLFGDGHGGRFEVLEHGKVRS